MLWIDAEKQKSEAEEKAKKKSKEFREEIIYECKNQKNNNKLEKGLYKVYALTSRLTGQSIRIRHFGNFRVSQPVSANLLKVVRQRSFLIIIGVAALGGILVLGCRLAATSLGT